MPDRGTTHRDVTVPYKGPHRISEPYKGPALIPGPPPLIPTARPITKPITPETPVTLAPRENLALASNTFERQLVLGARNEGVKVTYGRDRIPFVPLAALPDYDDLVLFGVWGRGEIDAIESVTISDRPPNYRITLTHYTGTAGQAFNTSLQNIYAGIGIAHTNPLAGIAYSVLRFPAGSSLGDIHGVIRGVKVYDPRNVNHTLGVRSTYTYSQNPALCLADLISNTTYGYGKAIDWASVTTTANACDDTTSGEAKRLIGITLDRRLRADQWFDVLRAHAGCYVIRSGGVYKLIPDAVSASVRTFNKADIIEGSNTWTTSPLSQSPNVVQVTYTDNSVLPWKTATAIFPAGGVPPNNEELLLTRLQMSGITRYSQALRECIERLNHGRIEGLTENFDTFADGLAIEKGDVFTINNGGLSGSIAYRCADWSMPEKGLLRITGKKYDPAAYNNSSLATPSTGNVTLPDPLVAPAPITSLIITELVATSYLVTSPLSRIRAVWTHVASPFPLAYIVKITDELTGGSSTLYEGTVTATDFTSPVLPSPGKYRVYVTAVIQSTSVQSTFVTDTIVLQLTSNTYELMWTKTVTVSGWSLLTASTVTEPVSVTTYFGRSEVFDLGKVLEVVVNFDTFATFCSANPTTRGYVDFAQEDGVFSTSVACNGSAMFRGRYFRLRASGPAYAGYNINDCVVTAKMPVSGESFTVTTSASAVAQQTLAYRYLKLLTVNPDPISTTFSTGNWSNPQIDEYFPNTIDIDARNASGTREVKDVPTFVRGVRGTQGRTNWALIKNGATASSSGEFSANYPASAAFNGDRSGTGWGAGTGGWSSLLPTLSRTLTSTFAAAKSIDEVIVTTLQDAYATPITPKYDTTFTLYGIQDFLVEWFNGSTWATAVTVTANSLVMRRFTGLNLTGVTAMRVNVTASPDGYARIVEFEPIGPA